MNKVLVFALIALASAAIVSALPCDSQKGAQICMKRNANCLLKVNKSAPADVQKAATCQCHYDQADCFYHLDCNGSSVWALMALCTREKCEKCDFAVYDSSVFVIPSLLVLLTSALVALFM